MSEEQILEIVQGMILASNAPIKMSVLVRRLKSMGVSDAACILEDMVWDDRLLEVCEDPDPEITSEMSPVVDRRPVTYGRCENDNCTNIPESKFKGVYLCRDCMCSDYIDEIRECILSSLMKSPLSNEHEVVIDV